MAKNKGEANQLRIIAGKWRGRKLTFPDAPGLRPTPDRVRETLFNWLQAHLGWSQCLDLFAGSGALGFEAASRGADSVVLVESDERASQYLQRQRELLKAENCQIMAQSARQFLHHCQSRFDIVFLDPPYQADLWSVTAQQLISADVLADQALIYVEYPAKHALPQLPSQWRPLKSKQAGEVGYSLFQYQKGE